METAVVDTVTESEIKLKLKNYNTDYYYLILNTRKEPEDIKIKPSFSVAELTSSTSERGIKYSPPLGTGH